MGGNGNGYVQLRRGIHEDKHRPKLPPLRFAAYIHLMLDADKSTGIATSSAKTLAARYGFTERGSREVLEALEKDGYIRRFPVQGKHGEYPILVNRYRPTTGAMSGTFLNAWKSISPDDLTFDSCDESGDDTVDESVNGSVNVGVTGGVAETPPNKNREERIEKLLLSTPESTQQKPRKRKQKNPSQEYSPEWLKLPWPSPERFIAEHNAKAPDWWPVAETLSDSLKERITEYTTQFQRIEWWDRVWSNLRQATASQSQMATWIRTYHNRGIGWLLQCGQHDRIENALKVHDGKYL